MSKLRTWLSGLLIVQLAVATLLFGQQLRNSQPPEITALVPFDEPQLTRVVISDGKQEVTLQRKDSKWVLPGLDQLPADNTRFEEVLKKIADLKTRWAITTSPSAHERFEVADDKYQRRIQLYAGKDLVATLYVGSSPGLRQSHLRADGSDAVYNGELASYELPAKAADWLDDNLLAARDATRISGPDYSIERGADGWSLTSADAASPAAGLDENSAENLAAALAGLRVQGVATAGRVAKQDAAAAGSTDSTGEEAAQEPTVIDLAVTGPEDRTWHYQFTHAGDTYTVKRSDLEPAFTIGQYDFERIAGVKRDALLARAPEQTGAGKEEGTETGAAPASGSS